MKLKMVMHLHRDLDHIVGHFELFKKCSLLNNISTYVPYGHRYVLRWHFFHLLNLYMAAIKSISGMTYEREILFNSELKSESDFDGQDQQDLGLTWILQNAPPCYRGFIWLGRSGRADGAPV